MKRALFDGWLGTEDGRGYLSVPGTEVADDDPVVLAHPEQFEDVPAPKVTPKPRAPKTS